MKRALLLPCLLVALAASLASPAVAAEASPSSARRMQALDQQILVALNRTRAQHGLRPLVVSGDLDAAAAAHSRAMLRQGFFNHNAPGGATFGTRVRSFYRSAGYTTWSIGENLIFDKRQMSADFAIASWLASPAHRANMLNPTWREVGIATLSAKSSSGVFGGGPAWVVTMDFGARTS
jgi:uncharacterized protein YkwD